MKQVKIVKEKRGPKYICLGKLASSGGPSSIVDLLGFEVAVFEPAANDAHAFIMPT